MSSLTSNNNKNNHLPEKTIRKDLITEWRLPKPEVGEDGEVIEWFPVVRVGRFIPFGYLQDPDDYDILIPIETELRLLEQAKKHLRQYSYRDVANWLSTHSGRSISHVGLMKRVKLEDKRRRQAAVQRHLADRYKEALQKAEALESQRLGGHRTRSFSNDEDGEDGE